jgi:hypothetical protein
VDRSSSGWCALVKFGSGVNAIGLSFSMQTAHAQKSFAH